jgi:serine protease AprX
MGKMSGSRVSRALALTAVGTTFALLAAAPASAQAATPSPLGSLLGNATNPVGGLLGTVGGTLGTLGGTLGSTVTTAVGVVSTATDTTLGLLTGADWGYSSGQTTMSDVNQSIGAAALQSAGVTGKGVGVALLDTGVVPVKGLTSGNVVNGPDLSLDNATTSGHHLDGFGHGTHLAGIIAGNDGTPGGFVGVAPGATLVNVRAGSDSGAVDVSQVIAGINWVVQHRNDAGLNVRVINLSYGTDGTQAYTSDPLTAAVERAWKAGIVVVVAGGNSGSQQPSLDNPATDPYVIAVGADDTNGTSVSLDDTVPTFSSLGSATRHVDLVAPGQSIVSLRDPGSYVDGEYPAAEVGTRFFKGSGTSQAAAVVSGAVALLLQERPSLTPDQVKALLTATASPVPSGTSRSRGAGLLNIAAASAANVGADTQTWPTSNGLGTLDGARGDDTVSDGNVSLTGQRDIFGRPWIPGITAGIGTGWTGGAFNGSTWTGAGWAGTSFASQTWGDVTWSGSDFAGVSWTSHAAASESWSAGGWTGDGWVSHSWSDAAWSSHSWSGNGW